MAVFSRSPRPQSTLQTVHMRHAVSQDIHPRFQQAYWASPNTDGTFPQKSWKAQRAVDNVSLGKLGWCAAEASFFDNLNEALAHIVTVAHWMSKSFFASIQTHMTSPGPLSSLRSLDGISRSLTNINVIMHPPCARPSSTPRNWPGQHLINKGTPTSYVERKHRLAATAAGFSLFTEQNSLVFICQSTFSHPWSQPIFHAYCACMCFLAPAVTRACISEA